MTVPQRIAHLLLQQGNLALIETPIKISFSIYLYWHARNQYNPTHQWVRTLIKQFSKM